MSYLQMKKWFRQHIHTPHFHVGVMHLPSGHEMNVQMRKILHNERFWMIVVLTFLMFFIAAVLMMSVGASQHAPNFPPLNPLYPLMP